MAGWIRNKVLVPVDFSDSSFAAVDEALKMVESADHLTVLHALPELSPLEPGEMWSTVTDESRIDHVVKALKKRLSGDAYAGITMEAQIGSPGHTITKFAEKIGADTIVIPSHGATGLAPLLLGSVAERVVRHAPCPVVVLRS